MYFVAFFLLFDFVFNALLFVVLFIVDWLLSDPVDPMIKRNLWVAIMVDYCVSNVVMSILAVSIGLVVKDKRFFRYRYDPLIGIRAMKDILFNTFIVVLSIPFFRLIVE
jgi:quinol-cytochrome oxidoreductase complex cytochrome b subunit